MTVAIKDLYTACSIAEGFADEEATKEEWFEAWAYLIKTGACWRLQGWYGRQAADFIDSGIIDKKGKIHWANLDELIETDKFGNPLEV